jgi:hypothetical protein
VDDVAHPLSLCFLGGKMTIESKFQRETIGDIERLFPNAVILKNDPGWIQGIPDLTILYGNRWAMLECKAYRGADRQPNQAYYIGKLNEMSFASFVYPENKDDVLDGIQRTFQSARQARIPWR